MFEVLEIDTCSHIMVRLTNEIHENKCPMKYNEFSVHLLKKWTTFGKKTYALNCTS